LILVVKQYRSFGERFFLAGNEGETKGGMFLVDAEALMILLLGHTPEQTIDQLMIMIRASSETWNQHFSARDVISTTHQQ
jgi:hypothetical protein